MTGSNIFFFVALLLGLLRLAWAAVISGGNVIEGAGLGAPLTNAGAPVSGTTYAGVAAVGAQLIDTTNGKLYINTGTQASPTWTVVGTQV